MTEPFCYPDNYFGPDIIFLMRSCEWKHFLPVLCQAKFKNELSSQPAALRTLVPKLLYCENRGNDKQKISRSLTPQQSKSWENVMKQLFDFNSGKREREVVRLMVQYPALATNAALPGNVNFDEYQVSEGEPSKKKEKHDYLVTIDQRNVMDLVGTTGKELFDCLKEKESLKS